MHVTRVVWPQYRPFSTPKAVGRVPPALTGSLARAGMLRHEQTIPGCPHWARTGGGRAAGLGRRGPRPRADWARVIRDLVDVRYADAERVVPVQDNLP